MRRGSNPKYRRVTTAPALPAWARRAAAMACCLLGTGCYVGLDATPKGSGGGDSAAGSDEGADSQDDEPPVDACGGTMSVEDTRIRRLSRLEYENTLRDLGLLGADEAVVDSLTGDVIIAGKMRGFLIGGAVDESLARDLLQTATTVAEHAVVDPSALLGCTPTTAADETSCVADFIAEFGRRAYRRTLTTQERDELLAVYASARATVDFAGSVQTLLIAILTAPDFLYLLEHDPDDAEVGDVVAVAGPELASRLSYFLWDSMPDEELLAAAEAGDLDDAAAVEAQARRMLADPRADRAIRRFLVEWTFVDGLAHAAKDPTQYGWFTPELAGDLRTSLLTTLESTLRGPEPTLAAFLAPSTMFVNEAIAQAYGIEGVSGDAFVEVEVDADQRPGLLTHPAVLALAAKATRADPIARGLFVREQLLCADLPPPPATDENGDPIDFDVPAPEPGVTNRERFFEHTASPSCSGCHTLLDPIGFGFEHYDAVGRYREIDENGNDVDASGEVIAAGDLDGTFDGASELLARMGGSQHVAECVATQWFRYSLGRREGAADGCTTDTIAQRFVESDMNIQELLIAIATSDALRYRRVGPV